MALDKESTISKPRGGFSMSLPKGKTLGKIKPKIASAQPAVVNEDAEDGEVKKAFVTGIGGGQVDTVEAEVQRAPRVIPLVANRWENPAHNAEPLSHGATDETRVPRTEAGGETNHEPPRASSSAAKTLDELAAEAIARESRAAIAASTGSGTDHGGVSIASDRVIGMSQGSAGATPEGGDTDAGARRNAPLLAQNMIPGMADIQGEDAKFRHDLGHRAEDLSARSQAYVEVPVGEFGAALLRGMGWSGPAGDGDGSSGSLRNVEPRHNRLGLGAQPKPPEEVRKSRVRKPGEKPRALEEEAKKLWEQRARQEAAKSSSSREASSKLSIMDVVEISEASAGAGARGARGSRKPRGMVLKTQGVPGLNKISVRLEDSGEEVILDRSSVVKVSEDDLARRPFAVRKASGSKRDRSRSRSRSSSNARGDRAGEGSKRSDGIRRRREGDGRDDGDDDSVDDGRDSRGSPETVKRAKRAKKDKKDKNKKRSKQEKERGKHHSARDRGSSPSPRRADGKGRRTDESDPGTGRDRDDRSPDRRDANGYRRKSRDERHNNHNRASLGYERGSGEKAANAESDSVWLRPDIRVRVVHKSYGGGRAYLEKGKVVDVPRPGEATVRMDSGDLILEGVKQRHLETVVPSRGGKVVVVRGRQRGATGKLLAKNKDDETALVQVFDDLRAIKLSLDDVAEFTAMLDEDVEDLGY